MLHSLLKMGYVLTKWAVEDRSNMWYTAEYCEACKSISDTIHDGQSNISWKTPNNSLKLDNRTYTGKESDKMTSVSVILCENVECRRHWHGWEMLIFRAKHCRQDTESVTVCWFTMAIHQIHWQIAVTVDLITKWTMYSTLCLAPTNTTQRYSTRNQECSVTSCSDSFEVSQRVYTADRLSNM